MKNAIVLALTLVSVSSFAGSHGVKASKAVKAACRAETKKVTDAKARKTAMTECVAKAAATTTESAKMETATPATTAPATEATH